MLLASKLRPMIARPMQVPARRRDLLRPRAGYLTLVHASAGYGKTAALAATGDPSWTWYNLDATDLALPAFASRLAEALRVGPLPAAAAATPEAAALELARRLRGRDATVTLDRFELLGDAIELGRFLGELMALAPALSLRVASRSRPLLPVERLRVEGRLVDVGPAELRLGRAEISCLLTAAWERPPQAAELDFADNVVGGWPAALQLWLAGLDDDGDPLDPLQPGQPLHEYLCEEVVGTLPDEVLVHVRRDWHWLRRRGPLLKSASTPARRLVADRMVRDRVAVLPGRDGWHLHPLLAAFAAVNASRRAGTSGVWRSAVASAEGRPPWVAIQTLGGLSVLVDGVPVPDSALPAPSRRLLELLLSLPGCRTTAGEAAQALWPRRQPRSARNSFNVALHGLRRALEPELTDGARSRYIVREAGQYRLCVERITCDAGPVAAAD